MTCGLQYRTSIHVGKYSVERKGRNLRKFNISEIISCEMIVW